MANPKVSILTPVFNGEKFISRLADCVLQQNFDDWEWIIVDDGSTDNTWEVLTNLYDPRIIVIHKTNSGVSDARNIALDAAAGEYIVFLDADDTLPVNSIRVRSDYLDSNQQVDIVNGSVRVLSDGVLCKLYSPDLSVGPHISRLSRLEPGVFFGVTFMFRRVRIHGVRFMPGVKNCEDLIFFMRLAHDNGFQYGAVSEVIYEYRIQNQSAMSDLNGLESGYIELLKQVKNMQYFNAARFNFLRRKVRSIMFRSWLGRRCFYRAIMVFAKF